MGHFLTQVKAGAGETCLSGFTGSTHTNCKAPFCLFNGRIWELGSDPSKVKWGNWLGAYCKSVTPALWVHFLAPESLLYVVCSTVSGGRSFWVPQKSLFPLVQTSPVPLWHCRWAFSYCLRCLRCSLVARFCRLLHLITVSCCFRAVAWKVPRAERLPVWPGNEQDKGQRPHIVLKGCSPNS